MEAKVYNLKNEVVGKVELPASIFGVKWNPGLVQQVVTAQLANKRRPWAHAKTRAEVRGGGRKPWRQKGTGRARHGSIRSPLWRHGGKAHGPSKLRDYSQKINKKMKRLAILSVLSRKFKDGEVKIFESLDIGKPKTKILAGTLRTLLGFKNEQKNFSTLLLADKENKVLARASANLPKTQTTSADSINLYDLLSHKNVFIDKNILGAMSSSRK
jgi:large subunit ribosomal protein L4